jgi:hypothetical protein
MTMNKVILVSPDTRLDIVKNAVLANRLLVMEHGWYGVNHDNQTVVLWAFDTEHKLRLRLSRDSFDAAQGGEVYHLITNLDYGIVCPDDTPDDNVLEE